MFDTLKTLQAQAADRRIIDLFDADANRADDFSVRMGELLFDYSKTNIDATSRQALIELALSRGVGEKRDAMFRGDKINDTENRAVLHTALRNLNATPVMVDGQDVMPDVLDTLARMEQFAHALRSGAYQGQGGTIRDVVNIGIGDLIWALSWPVRRWHHITMGQTATLYRMSMGHMCQMFWPRWILQQR